MTAEDPANPDYLGVTTEEVSRYLAAKGASANCQSCSKNDWSVVNPSSDGAVHLPLQKDPNSVVVGGPAVPVVIMICKNCGFVRSHALLSISRWKSEEIK